MHITLCSVTTYPLTKKSVCVNEIFTVGKCLTFPSILQVMMAAPRAAIKVHTELHYSWS